MRTVIRPRWRHGGAVALLVVAGLAGFGAAAAPPSAAPAAAGERVYRDGLLPSGQPLRALRDAGPTMQGADAACVNCHRRSGLGMTEGRRVIPPIAGRYLFHPRAQTAEELDLPYVEGLRPDRDPYSDETLARAIRAGVGADGQPLSYLMPRFELDDAAMSALIAYLKSMDEERVPGVADGVLHFATIITPDADPVRKRGMLAVLQQYFTDKNAAVRSTSPRLHASRRMMWRVVRRWQLHVWELTGPSSTWEAQLERRLRAEPVFAVLSGLAGRTWAPVERFCEREALPCLFPNVEAPTTGPGNYYTLYFSRGVLLEADLIAQALRAPGEGAAQRRVVQVLRAGDVGEAAATALGAALGHDGVEVLTHRLPARATAGDLAAALAGVAAADRLVLWLRPDDLRALGPAPVPAGGVWLSGLMAGLDAAPLPAAWRDAAHMAYPVDLPEKRVVRVDYPLGWFHIRQLPVVAVETQVDTYLACGLVAETLSHMVDTFARDYLIERIEAMLEHRVLTGYYPRLALGPGQRFASKGGYVVHFAAGGGAPRPVPDGDWIVPGS